MKRLGFFERLLNKFSINYVWFPFMVPETVNSTKCMYLGTCHDLFCRLSNDDDSIRKMFNKASMIVSISEYVKRQITDLYDISEDKIKVIPNAIAMNDRCGDLMEIKELAGKKYILDCNSYIERKNTIVLLKAFERIKNVITDDLVFCGGYKDEDYFCKCSKFINDHGLSKRVHMYVAVNDEQKNWLFNNCSLFVAPSENEGFGRTPIEAAMCKKTVISSRASALEESTCGLLHYIENPEDDKELAEAITSLLKNPDDAERLSFIKETYKNTYSVEKIAKHYINIFKELGWISDKNYREKNI